MQTRFAICSFPLRQNMKFYNASRWGTAIAAVLMGFSLVGCGGGGGGGDSSQGPGSPAQAPAPDSVGGNSITMHSATAETRVLNLLPDGNTWTELRDGNTVSGTYRYQKIADQSTGEVVLSDGTAETALVLTFHTENSGSFTYRDQGLNGTFELQPIGGSPDPGDPPPNDGIAPSSLKGKTMFGTRTFTSTGPVGQTHVYTFSGNNFHDSDPPEESDGSYTYTAKGDQANLTLNYTSPSGFDGDKHEVQMTFHTDTAGAFDSVYTRRDGTVITIRGNFTLE
jgi:hypothetical protein